MNDILRGENATQPITLSWMLAYDNDPSAVNLVQSSYEIEVKNSLMVASFGGASELNQKRSALRFPLRSAGARFDWRVRVQLSNGANTTWSATNAFEVEPSGPFEGVQWIGSEGQLRLKDGFIAPAQFARATLRVSGVGAFYSFINGKRVGQNFMDPPVYSKTVYYQTFDVMNLIKAGARNDVGALIGIYKFGYDDLWCNQTKFGPRGCKALILSLVAEFANGTSVTLASTSSAKRWETRGGPIAYDHLFHGETYDARIEIDWAGKRTSEWTAAWERRLLPQHQRGSK